MQILFLQKLNVDLGPFVNFNISLELIINNCIKCK